MPLAGTETPFPLHLLHTPLGHNLMPLAGTETLGIKLYVLE